VLSAQSQPYVIVIRPEVLETRQRGEDHGIRDVVSIDHKRFQLREHADIRQRSAPQQMVAAEAAATQSTQLGWRTPAGLATGWHHASATARDDGAGPCRARATCRQAQRAGQAGTQPE